MERGEALGVPRLRAGSTVASSPPPRAQPGSAPSPAQPPAPSPAQPPAPSPAQSRRPPCPAATAVRGLTAGSRRQSPGSFGASERDGRERLREQRAASLPRAPRPKVSAAGGRAGGETAPEPPGGFPRGERGAVPRLLPSSTEQTLRRAIVSRRAAAATPRRRRSAALHGRGGPPRGRCGPRLRLGRPPPARGHARRPRAGRAQPPPPEPGAAALSPI